MRDAPSGAPATILLVEDEPVVASFMVELLTFAGYRVETVPDGVAALSALESLDPAAIVSDAAMPNMDGPTLYAEIDRRHPHLRHRFLLLAGDVESERIREFLDRTRVPYLAKPFRIDQALDAVRRITG